jgi:hypothetical protein
LVPKTGVSKELLYVAAAVVRQERWRFNYGRKITPDRIAGFPLPMSDAVLASVQAHLASSGQIEKLALEEADDEADAAAARQSLSKIDAHPDTVVRDKDLDKKLEQWLSK